MITCGETLRIIGMPLIVLQNKLIINQGLSGIDRNRLEAAFEKVSPHLMISIRGETLPLQSLSQSPIIIMIMIMIMLHYVMRLIILVIIGNNTASMSLSIASTFSAVVSQPQLSHLWIELYWVFGLLLHFLGLLLPQLLHL